MSDLPFGIDISRWNSNKELTRHPDFDKMIQGGVKFIAMRAGISWGYKDPTFDRNWGEASRVRLPRIAYHVPYFHQPVESQSSHFLRIVEGTGVNWGNDRLALDLEVDGGQPRAKITDVTCGMMERLKSITGRYPILYSRASWVDTFMAMNDLLADADWWLAQYYKANPAPQYTPEYPCPPRLPKGVNHWLIHQTAEKGNGSAVGVVSYYVDLNRWNGSLQDMYAYFGMSEPVEPDPDDPPVVIDPPKPLYRARVTTTPPNRLRVRRTPNGEFVRWLQPNDIVDVYQETEGWVRIGVGEWVMRRWIERLNERPDALPVPLYSQRDPRWENDLMGSSGITLGQEGCLVTATASGLSFLLGETITPKEYNRQQARRAGINRLITCTGSSLM